MPNVTLRLSDEQHRQLVEAALQSGRSLQKEIIWRLFGKQGTVLRPEPQKS